MTSMEAACTARAYITPLLQHHHGHHRGGHFYHFVIAVVVIVVLFGEVDGHDTLLLLEEYKAHG